MELTAPQVADFFLRHQDPEDRIDHLKLQKLCYYAQGLHLALYGRPLFNEALLAWKHGPVVRSLWNRYQYTSYSPLEVSAEFDESRVAQETASFLAQVYKEYGQYSPWRLREMTHAERPWLEAKERSSQVLDTETMRQYFREQLEKRLSERPKLTSEQIRELVQNDPQIRDAVARGRIDFEVDRFAKA